MGAEVLINAILDHYDPIRPVHASIFSNGKGGV
jgi:hypothetical protein